MLAVAVRSATITGFDLCAGVGWNSSSKWRIPAGCSPPGLFQQVGFEHTRAIQKVGFVGRVAWPRFTGFRFRVAISFLMPSVKNVGISLNHYVVNNRWSFMNYLVCDR